MNKKLLGLVIFSASASAFAEPRIGAVCADDKTQLLRLKIGSFQKPLSKESIVLNDVDDEKELSVVGVTSTDAGQNKFVNEIVLLHQEGSQGRVDVDIKFDEANIVRYQFEFRKNAQCGSSGASIQID